MLSQLSAWLDLHGQKKSGTREDLERRAYDHIDDEMFTKQKKGDCFPPRYESVKAKISAKQQSIQMAQRATVSEGGNRQIVSQDAASRAEANTGDIGHSGQLAAPNSSQQAATTPSQASGTPRLDPPSDQALANAQQLIAVPVTELLTPSRPGEVGA